MEDVMAFAFGYASATAIQSNPVPGNIIFSLNGEHHLLTAFIGGLDKVLFYFFAAYLVVDRRIGGLDVSLRNLSAVRS